jgi:choline dehydrogenase
MTQGFDFIVIGAGTAGCVVAARLSQDPAVSVLLLEAGGPNDDARIETPAKFDALVNTKFDWGFRTCAQAELHNR